MKQKTTGRWLSDAVLVLFGRAGGAALEFAVVAVAARHVTADELGLVFLAQGGAIATGAVAGMGLHLAILRRSARGELARGLLLRATVLRAIAFLVASGIALSIGIATGSPALLLTGFLLAYGLEEVHGPSRMVVLGKERFGVDLTLMLVGRGMGSAAAIAALVAGGGLAGWCVARLLGELVFLGLATWAALRELRDGPGGELGGLLREGRPFWLVDLLALASGRTHAFVVAAVLGLSAAAAHGVAWRVIGGALLVVSSLVSAAFPRWSRERRGAIPPRDALVFVGIGVAIGLALFAAAPIAAALLLPSDTATVTLLIRLMAVAGLAAALHEPLQAWLFGRNRERAAAISRLAAGALGLSGLAFLLQWWGLAGAAVGLSVEHALVLLLLAVVARVTASRAGTEEQGAARERDAP